MKWNYTSVRLKKSLYNKKTWEKVLSSEFFQRKDLIFFLGNAKLRVLSFLDETSLVRDFQFAVLCNLQQFDWQVRAFKSVPMRVVPRFFSIQRTPGLIQISYTGSKFGWLPLMLYRCSAAVFLENCISIVNPYDKVKIRETSW